MTTFQSNHIKLNLQIYTVGCFEPMLQFQIIPGDDTKGCSPVTNVYLE